VSKKNNEEKAAGDGSRAITKVRISDVVFVIIIGILCLSCILPFIHVAAKSISGKAAVSANQIFLWPKDLTFAAYKQIFKERISNEDFYIEITRINR